MIDFLPIFAAAFGYTPRQFWGLSWPDFVALADTAHALISRRRPAADQ